MVRLVQVGVLLALVWGLAPLASAEEKPAPMSPAQAFEQLKGWDYDQPRRPLTVLELYIQRAAGDPQARRQVAERLTAVLADPKATDAARQFAFQQLPLVATDAEAPLVAKMLDDPKTADTARRTLERIPGEASLHAIREALPRMKGLALVGVVNSLGARRDAASTEAIAGLLRDADLRIAAAAAVALGKVGTADAGAALLKVADKADVTLRPVLRDALLRCADRLIAEQKPKEAEAIYHRLMLDSESPVPLRLALMSGLARVNKEATLPLVLDALGARNAALQAGAVRLARDLPGSNVAAALVQQLDKLDAQGQALVIEVLAERGDRSAADAVAKRLDDKNEMVRAAAAQAMARLGDASCVERLAIMAAQEKGAVREAAQSSLARLAGADVDKRILAAAAEGEPAVRTELLRAIAARRAAGAVPLLLKAAADADAGVREAALDALGVLGSAEDYPKLVQLLAAAKGPSETAEKAVLAVGGRLAGSAERAGPVVAALKVAPAEAKPFLLRVLGNVGGAEALQAVREHLAAGDAGVRDAAVRAMANWPDEAAAADLLKLAKDSENPTHRALALRGYLRLARETKDEAARMKMFGQVRPIATSTEAKKALLAGLADVADPAALDVALGLLDDREVQAEAAAAALKIAKALPRANRAAVQAAAKRIKNAVSDKAVRAEADALLKAPAKAAGGAASQAMPAHDQARSDARKKELAQMAPKGCRVACYLDCGPDAEDGAKGGPVLRVAAGEPYFWTGSEAAAPARYGTIAYDGRQVVFEAGGLNPGKEYQVGFSWWDYDHNTRAQSVWAASGKGQRETKILDETKLPSGAAGQKPEEKTVALPRSVYADGSLRLMFRSEAGPNVAVSEVWLLESEAGGAAPPAAEKPAATRADPGPQEAPRDSPYFKLTRGKAEPGRTTRILVVTGQEHPAHKWRATAPVLAEELAKDGRLLVDVSEEPGILASSQIADYAALVLHYMNPKPSDLGAKGRENFRRHVEGGKGLMLVHFACGAFQEWPEFRDVAGRVWDPKLRGHDPRGPFRVEITPVKHPITEGLRAFDADDELYTCLTGERPIDVLATAKSKVDGKDYPMAFVYAPGKGRVFQCLLGHDVKAMRVPAVGELYRRGCAWAAGLPPAAATPK